MKLTPEQAAREAREKKYRALQRESNKADRLCREISKHGWEWEIWESYRPGTCFAPQWRFEAWKMYRLGECSGWISSRYRYRQEFEVTRKEAPPLVVLGWSRLEAVERFYKMFCLPKEEL